MKASPQQNSNFQLGQAPYKSIGMTPDVMQNL